MVDYLWNHSRKQYSSTGHLRSPQMLYRWSGIQKIWVYNFRTGFHGWNCSILDCDEDIVVGSKIDRAIFEYQVLPQFDCSKIQGIAKIFIEIFNNFVTLLFLKSQLSFPLHLGFASRVILLNNFCVWHSIESIFRSFSMLLSYIGIGGTFVIHSSVLTRF